MKYVLLLSSLLLAGCPQSNVDYDRIEYLMELGSCAEFCRENNQYFTGVFATTYDEEGKAIRHCDCEPACGPGEFKPGVSK